ncbi:MAG TPA: molecular chaperone TorD family protein [Anaerolineae bacterium]
MDPTNETPLNAQELTELARARASFYAFANIHFTNLPDMTFVNHVRSSNFLDALDALMYDASMPEDITKGAALMRGYLDSTMQTDGGKLTEYLGVDRTRLYRGLSPSYGPPPPYEAVWSKTERDVPTILMTISGIYQQVGMTVSEQARDRLDYVGVELDYEYQLAIKEAEAWQAGEAEKAADLLKRQEMFMREHLGMWVPGFVEKALTMAETDFYRGHLMMLRGFLAAEQERLQVILEDLGDKTALKP